MNLWINRQYWVLLACSWACFPTPPWDVRSLQGIFSTPIQHQQLKVTHTHSPDKCTVVDMWMSDHAGLIFIAITIQHFDTLHWQSPHPYLSSMWESGRVVNPYLVAVSRPHSGTAAINLVPVSTNSSITLTHGWGFGGSSSFTRGAWRQLSSRFNGDKRFLHWMFIFMYLGGGIFPPDEFLVDTSIDFLVLESPSSRLHVAGYGNRMTDTVPWKLV